LDRLVFLLVKYVQPIASFSSLEKQKDGAQTPCGYFDRMRDMLTVHQQLAAGFLKGR
jgi:hypothetical protein